MNTKKIIAWLALGLVSATGYASSTRILDGQQITNNGAVLTLPTTTTTIIGDTTTNTLTNKSISGTNNTFTNIPNSATTAASANTASAIVARDSSGNFTAGVITMTQGTVSGTPTNATDIATKGYVDTGLGTKVNTSAVGANNGVASLDSGGKIPIAQLPASVFVYQGTWNASTNSPSLADGTGTSGYLYRVTVAGTQDLGSGSQTFVVGDYVIYNGSIWQLAHSGADAVISVNGQAGAVTLTTTNISEGTNLYFTNTRAQTAAVENAINSGTTNKAPSEDAVFNALAAKLSTSGGTITSSSNVANALNINETGTAAALGIFKNGSNTATWDATGKISIQSSTANVNVQPWLYIAQPSGDTNELLSITDSTGNAGVHEYFRIESDGSLQMNKVGTGAIFRVDHSTGNVTAFGSVAATQVDPTNNSDIANKHYVDVHTGASAAPVLTGSTGTPQSITAAGGIAFTGSSYNNIWFIKGNGGAVTVTADPQIAAGTNVGQVLRLVGEDNTDTVTLSDGTGLSLNGAWVGAKDSILNLVWDGTNWVEMNRR